ncbi:TolC family outer membrane protein [Crenobacter cavernae]|uniref:Type I secretion system n=1 Tax=Crenobacter cavernae TaxID=2290923 RepID=A0ABY0FFD4_9NEIS|nr:TolC family outer membrane protein [Crenobacter cavernae]RXZ43621.1 type I secretion system [Crenobacter cavernae]
MKPFRITLIAVAALTLAQGAAAFDLVDAWRAARDFDVGFSASRHERDAGQEKAVQGRSRILPQVGLSANYRHNRPIEPAGLASFNSHGYGVELTQPLFDVPRYAGYQKGKTGTRLANVQFSAAEQQLIVDVARAYFDVLLANDTLASVRSAKAAFAKQLEQAKTAFEVGTATITDTYEAQAGFDAARAREIAAESDLEVKREALRRLTSLSPDKITPIDEKLALAAPQPAALGEWATLAEANSLAIKSDEEQLELAKQDLLEKRGQRLPTVSLAAGYNDTVNNSPASSLASRQTRGSAIGVTLSVPLFAGGGLSSQVREAAANELKARDTLEASRRQVREDVRRAYLGVTNGAALVRAQEQLLASSKSKLEATRLGKEVGVRTTLDLLQAEQAYSEAVRSLAESRYTYLNARLALSQAAGLLDAARLEEVNRAMLARR